MPPAQDDSGSDDLGLTAYRPGKERWLRLPGVLAGMFPSPQTSIEFLERDMLIPRARIPDFGLDQAPEDYWLRILNLFDAGDLIDAPYHRLFAAVQRRKVFNEPFDAIFGDYPDTGGEADQVDAPAPEPGCHVIVRTRDELVRERIRKWLESEQLGPEIVWSVHEMTSFSVSETDDEQVRTLIMGRWHRALVKVIPPGHTDELIGALHVADEDELALTVPQVPIQLTVGELGAVAARFHPAEASTSTRTATGRRRAETATHVGDGITQQAAMDGTLLLGGFSDDHRVTIRSLKYAEINVVFVGACPQWNGSGRLGESRVSKELDQIRHTTRLRHIRLAGEFMNATREHLAEIMHRKPDILHISCHAANGCLYWEDDESNADEIPAEWLAECIAERAGRRLAGIVLSASHGESAGSFLTAAAREIIAYEGLIAEEQAPVFTAKFYDELSRMPVLRTAAPRAARRAGLQGRVLVFPSQAQGAG